MKHENWGDILKNADDQLDCAIDQLVHLRIDSSDYVRSLQETASQLSRLTVSSFADKESRRAMSAALPLLSSKSAMIGRLLDSAAALYFGYSGNCIQVEFGYTADGAVESAQTRASMQLEA